MRYLEILITLLFMLVSWGCEKDELTLPNQESIDANEELNRAYWGIDTTNRIIVYNGNSINIIDGELIIGDNTLEIEADSKTISIGKAYKAMHLNKEYDLFYTQLPIILIATYGPEVLDAPKIGGKIKLLEKNARTFNAFLGIELRGGVSQLYPKKSYNIELWEDATGDFKLKESLLGMRIDDDWILDGMWNEPNRIRDFTSHGLWLEIGRINNPTSKTKLGISRRYCELFLNGKYCGVYYLGEKIDRKQLNLKKYDSQMEGELYKGYNWEGGVTYQELVDFDNSRTTWNGYEAKYPDDIGMIDWSYLYNHIYFVINSSQTDFNSKISARIDLNNAIDYYIFLNLIYATDNRGKNVYTCKLDKSSPYFFVAWDMDGSFGNNWRGDRTDVTTRLLSNGLYDKLLAYPGFKQELKLRWAELRSKNLDNEKLVNRFVDNNDYLIKNAIHEREALVPELSQNYSEEEINFIESWIERRLAFLDAYFAGM